MTCLPIVEREMRAASRRKGTHWLRFCAASLVVAAVFVLLLGGGGSGSVVQAGRQVFRAVSVLAFGFCLLAGVFVTSDCLCSEKRDGTLGLLFLTDLHGYDVVLGKLAASSLVSAYAVLAVVPMLGLPLLMGGVTFAEFGRMTLVLFVTLLLSLATGMMASALCRETRSALFASFCVVAGLAGGFFLVGLLARLALGGDPTWLLAPSPIMAFVASGADVYDLAGGGAQFWTSIGMVTGIAVGQLIVTSVRLPRLWQEDATDPAPCRPPEAGRIRRQVPFAANPFEWLARRDPVIGWAGATALLVVFGIWLWLFMAVMFEPPRKAPPFFIAAFFVAAGLHIVVKGLLAVHASRRLCEDRRSGALELLLTTPLSPKAILSGQWRVLKRQFAWLNAGLVLMNLAMVAMVVTDTKQLDMPGEVSGLFALFFLGGVFLLWVDFQAIGWVAMWMGLRGLRHHRAVLHSLLRVMVPPWIAIILFVFVVMGSGIQAESMTVCWFVWISLCVVTAQVATLRRKRELLLHFRQIACGPVSSRMAAKN
jgi:ABC-type transport system involved in multi-copper enzyme maturation permease subunit